MRAKKFHKKNRKLCKKINKLTFTGGKEKEIAILHTKQAKLWNLFYSALSFERVVVLGFSNKW